LPERNNIISEPYKQRRVFVVDDEAIIAWSVATILRLKGFDATSFTEPLAALLAARSEAPDLLIADVVMPVLSGIDLAIQLQECCPYCKILLFSGQAATSNLLDAAREGGHDFEILTKPVHPEDLLKRIHSVTDDAASGLPAQEVPSRTFRRRTA
jgi:FixJ family two-component response regulator